MTGFPHPAVLMTVAYQRHADLQAQAARYRRVRSIPPSTAARRVWPDRAAVVAVVVALLLAVRGAVGAA